MCSGWSRTWRPTLALWAVVLALCAVVAGASWAVQARLRRAVAEVRARQALSYQLYNALRAVNADSIEQFEAVHNGGRQLPRVPSEHPSRVTLVMPGEALGPEFRGWAVQTTFFRRTGAAGDGADAYATGYFRPVAPPPVPVGPSVATMQQVSRLRQAFLVFGAAGWVIGLVTLPFARPWRRQVAQVMLACAVVAVAGWASEPRRDWSLPGVWSPVPVGLALAALASVAVMLPPVRGGSPDARRCHACGYDLTGNVSGVCPECGQPTPRGSAERWHAVAERIERVGKPREVDEAVIPPAEPA